MSVKKCIIGFAVLLLFLPSAAQTQQSQRGLTASELVQQALERNRDFLATNARVTEAEALLRQAGLRPNPTIEVESKTGWLLGSKGETEQSVAYFYPFETAGKRDKRLQVAEKSKELAQAEIQERKRQLSFDVKTRFVQAVAQYQKLQAINRIIPINRENYQVTASRVALGDAPALEQQLLLTDVNRAEAQQVSLSSGYDAAFVELKMAVGLSRSDSLNIVSNFELLDPQLTLEQLQQSALQNRPDLQILRLLEEQALAEGTLARAEGTPDITGSARYSHTTTRFDQFGLSGTGAVLPLKDSDNILTFGISIPVFSKKRTQGQVDAASARQTEARLRREYLQEAISHEVDAAYRRWSGSKRVMGMLQTGVVQQSEKNLNVIREAYRLGQLRVMDVLNEQRRLVDTELAYIDAQAEAAQALTELERAIGGNLP